MIHLYARFSYVLTVALLTLCTLNLSAQCTDNLVNNPDFEANGGSTSGYYTFGNGTLTIVNDTPDGSASATFVSDDPGEMGSVFIGQGINSGITAGEEYEFSVDVKAAAAGVGDVTIGMDYRDANGSSAGFDFEQESISPSDTEFTRYTFTRLAPLADPGAGRPNDAARVQIFLSINNGAQITVDNFQLRTLEPTVSCAGNLLANGTVNDNDSGFSPYGSGVNFLADGGISCGGALQTACSGGGCGVGQYGVAATAGQAYELRFKAKTNTLGTYQEGELRYSDGSGVLTTTKVPVRGDNFTDYRLVLGAAPSGASIDIQFNADNGTDIVFDEFCLTPFAVEPVEDIPGNLIVGGDFENGATPFTSQSFNTDQVNDPSTGLTAQYYNRDAYGFGQTADLPVSEGRDYEIQVDAKVIGSANDVKVNVKWYDVNGDQIGGRQDNTVNQTEDFTSQTFTVTAPGDAVNVRVEFETEEPNGYVVIDNLAFIDLVSLPVTLASFDGEAVGKQNRLTWVTTTEENTDRFRIERSADGTTNWREIVTVSAAGYSSEVLTYAATDEQPLATSYYRLRTEDVDGSEDMSSVVMVARQDGLGLRAYPNPMGEVLVVATDFTTATQFRLVDLLGRTVRSGEIAAGNQQLELPVANLPHGRYLLRAGDETITVIK